VKLKLFWMGVAGLVLAAPMFGAEQPAAAASGNVHWILLAAAFAMAIASGLCGLAQGKAISAACEGMGRNPGAAGAIRGIAMGHLRAARGAQPASPALPMVRMIESRRTNFFPLDDTPREFVFGLAGQPWNNVGVRLKAEDFGSWAPPDNVKIAANFLIEDAGNGRSRVITETRVAATDESARGKMARYWALIYPGSGMIRRSLLSAIRERAERR